MFRSMLMAGVLALGLVGAASAATLGFMTWNIIGAQADASSLASHASSAASAMGSVDVLMLQEAIAQAQVGAVVSMSGWGDARYSARRGRRDCSTQRGKRSGRLSVSVEKTHKRVSR